jgi:WD40 repeat protein
MLASSGTDQTVKIWDVDSGKELSTVPQAGRLGSVTFSPDGKLLALVSSDGEASLWDVDTAKRIRTFKGVECINRSVCFSPDSSVLAASMEGLLYLWQVRTGKQVAMTRYKSWITCIRFSPSGKILAGAGLDGTIFQWNLSFMANQTERKGQYDRGQSRDRLEVFGRLVCSGTPVRACQPTGVWNWAEEAAMMHRSELANWQCETLL